MNEIITNFKNLVWDCFLTLNPKATIGKISQDSSYILKSSRIKAMDTKNPFQPCSKSESLSTSLVNNSKFIFPFQKILGIGRE